MRDEQIGSLAERLDNLAEQLADLALELLGEAMSDEDPKTSDAARTERVVTRARRSVEKASMLLGGINGAADQDDC